MKLACDRSAPAHARHALVEAFACLATPIRQQSELIVSELVTNAVLHGSEPIVFRADRRGDRLRIEVHDGSTRMGPPTEHSRGLELIARVASAWGVQRHAPGKTVWAEMLLD
ncbi:MAG TPA: ATP-binding protein [Acidimicrobiia bacterium]|nr:ATP-binding protein [Acidimicrobiia bacterium]